MSTLRSLDLYLHTFVTRDSLRVHRSHSTLRKSLRVRTSSPCLAEYSHHGIYRYKREQPPPSWL